MENKKLTWLQLMLKNWYIQLFGVAIAFLIVLIVKKDESLSTAWWIALCIPIAMMGVISYFGFYKFWKEYKNS